MPYSAQFSTASSPSSPSSSPLLHGSTPMTKLQLPNHKSQLFLPAAQSTSLGASTNLRGHQTYSCHKAFSTRRFGGSCDSLICDVHLESVMVNAGKEIELWGLRCWRSEWGNFRRHGFVVIARWCLANLMAVGSVFMRYQIVFYSILYLVCVAVGVYIVGVAAVDVERWCGESRPGISQQEIS